MASNPPAASTDFTPDPGLPSQDSGLIMEAFGVSGDWAAALDAATDRLDAPGNSGGVAPAPEAPSAEGSGEQGSQAQPAPTPPQQGDGVSPPQAQPEPAGVQPPPPPAAAPAPPPAPPVAAVDSNSEVATLRAQVQALVAQISALQAAPQAQPPASGATPAQPTADELTQYRLAVPQQIVTALSSDEPAQVNEGLHALVNSLGATIHQRVMQHVDQVLNGRFQEFGSYLEVSTQQRQMQQDYYTSFPQHNDPATKFIVQQEAQALWAANPNLTWDENTRNTLGARVNARLGLVQQAQPQPFAAPAPPAPQPVPRPAPQMGATTRPAPVPTTPSDEISAILSG